MRSSSKKSNGANPGGNSIANTNTSPNTSPNDQPKPSGATARNRKRARRRRARDKAPSNNSNSNSNNSNNNIAADAMDTNQSGGAMTALLTAATTIEPSTPVLNADKTISQQPADADIRSWFRKLSSAERLAAMGFHDDHFLATLLHLVADSSGDQQAHRHSCSNDDTHNTDSANNAEPNNNTHPKKEPLAFDSMDSTISVGRQTNPPIHWGRMMTLSDMEDASKAVVATGGLTGAGTSHVTPMHDDVIVSDNAADHGAMVSAPPTNDAVIVGTITPDCNGLQNSTTTTTNNNNKGRTADNGNDSDTHSTSAKADSSVNAAPEKEDDASSTTQAPGDAYRIRDSQTAFGPSTDAEQPHQRQIATTASTTTTTTVGTTAPPSTATPSSTSATTNMDTTAEPNRSSNKSNDDSIDHTQPASMEVTERVDILMNTLCVIFPAAFDFSATETTAQAKSLEVPGTSSDTNRQLFVTLQPNFMELMDGEQTLAAFDQALSQGEGGLEAPAFLTQFYDGDGSLWLSNLRQRLENETGAHGTNTVENDHGDEKGDNTNHDISHEHQQTRRQQRHQQKMALYKLLLFRFEMAIHDSFRAASKSMQSASDAQSPSTVPSPEVRALITSVSLKADEMHTRFGGSIASANVSLPAALPQPISTPSTIEIEVSIQDLLLSPVTRLAGWLSLGIPSSTALFHRWDDSFRQSLTSFDNKLQPESSLNATTDEESPATWTAATPGTALPSTTVAGITASPMPSAAVNTSAAAEAATTATTEQASTCSVADINNPEPVQASAETKSTSVEKDVVNPPTDDPKTGPEIIDVAAQNSKVTVSATPASVIDAAAATLAEGNDSQKKKRKNKKKKKRKNSTADASTQTSPDVSLGASNTSLEDLSKFSQADDGKDDATAVRVSLGNIEGAFSSGDTHAGTVKSKSTHEAQKSVASNMPGASRKQQQPQQQPIESDSTADASRDDARSDRASSTSLDAGHIDAKVEQDAKSIASVTTDVSTKSESPASGNMNTTAAPYRAPKGDAHNSTDATAASSVSPTSVPSPPAAAAPANDGDDNDDAWETVEVRSKNRKKSGGVRFGNQQSFGSSSNSSGGKKSKTPRSRAARRSTANRKMAREILSTVLDAVDTEVQRRRVQPLRRDAPGLPTSSRWPAPSRFENRNSGSGAKPSSMQQSVSRRSGSTSVSASPKEGTLRDVLLGTSNNGAAPSARKPISVLPKKSAVGDTSRRTHVSPKPRNDGKRLGRDKAAQTSIDQNTTTTVPETLSAVSTNSMTTNGVVPKEPKVSKPNEQQVNIVRSDSSLGDSANHQRPRTQKTISETQNESSASPPLPTLLSPENANSAGSSVASSLDAPHSGRHHLSSSAVDENDVGYHLLDVCDRLTRDMTVFMRRRSHALQLRRSERNSVLIALEETLSGIWPDMCSVEMYGSCATQLDLPSSDLDVVVCGLDSMHLQHMNMAGVPSSQTSDHPGGSVATGGGTIASDTSSVESGNPNFQRLDGSPTHQQQQQQQQQHHSHHHHRMQQQTQNYYHQHPPQHRHMSPVMMMGGLTTNGERVLRLAQELEAQPWAVQVKPIPTATVPVVKILADPARLASATGKPNWMVGQEGAVNHQVGAPGHSSGGEHLETSGSHQHSSLFHSTQTPPVWRGADVVNGLLKVDITFQGPEHGGIGSTEFSTRVVQDVCIQTGLRPEDTPAVQTLMVLKELLAQRRLNEPFSGGLSSYALLLLVVSMMRERSVIREELERVERQRRLVAEGVSVTGFQRTVASVAASNNGSSGNSNRIAETVRPAPTGQAREQREAAKVKPSSSLAASASDAVGAATQTTGPAKGKPAPATAQATRGSASSKQQTSLSTQQQHQPQPQPQQVRSRHSSTKPKVEAKSNAAADTRRGTSGVVAGKTFASQAQLTQKNAQSRKSTPAPSSATGPAGTAKASTTAAAVARKGAPRSTGKAVLPVTSSWASIAKKPTASKSAPSAQTTRGKTRADQSAAAGQNADKAQPAPKKVNSFADAVAKGSFASKVMMGKPSHAKPDKSTSAAPATSAVSQPRPSEGASREMNKAGEKPRPGTSTPSAIFKSTLTNSKKQMSGNAPLAPSSASASSSNPAVSASSPQTNSAQAHAMRPSTSGTAAAPNQSDTSKSPKLVTETHAAQQASAARDGEARRRSTAAATTAAASSHQAQSKTPKPPLPRHQPAAFDASLVNNGLVFPQGFHDVIEVLCSGETTSGKLLMHFLLFYGQHFDSQATAIDYSGKHERDYSGGKLYSPLSPYIQRKSAGSYDPMTGMLTVDPIVVYDPLEGAESNNVARSCFAWSSIRCIFAQAYLSLSNAAETSGASGATTSLMHRGGRQQASVPSTRTGGANGARQSNAQSQSQSQSQPSQLRQSQTQPKAQAQTSTQNSQLTKSQKPQGRSLRQGASTWNGPYSKDESGNSLMGDPNSPLLELLVLF